MIATTPAGKLHDDGLGRPDDLDHRHDRNIDQPASVIAWSRVAFERGTRSRCWRVVRPWSHGVRLFDREASSTEFSTCVDANAPEPPPGASISVTRASPARVFWLVVTRQLFAGAPAIFREGGGVCPISVAGLTAKSITEGCAALHHVAILPAHRCVALALVSGNGPAFP